MLVFVSVRLCVYHDNSANVALFKSPLVGECVCVFMFWISQHNSIRCIESSVKRANVDKWIVHGAIQNTTIQLNWTYYTGEITNICTYANNEELIITATAAAAATAKVDVKINRNTHNERCATVVLVSEEIRKKYHFPIIWYRLKRSEGGRGYKVANKWETTSR